jgi:dTDP-4-amino-4,6-dideoxygalactose transaminase
MFVGGEFYYDRQWITEKRTLSTDGQYFLNGGTACLIVIGDYLIDHGIKKILLPSYLCPSIVTTLERCGLECSYYQVNRDLSIDINDLSGKLTTLQAVYLINYFGFIHPADIREFFSDLRQKGMIVIEDNAQVGFGSHPTGDFIFNSMRKLVPFDGGYLITEYDLQPYLLKYSNQPNHRLPAIREYRKKLYSYLIEGVGSYEELVNLFNLSEAFYADDMTVLGDQYERDQIEHLDWQGIKQTRRENFNYMLASITNIPEISPIFTDLPEGVMPMGFPVYFTGVSRDLVNEELGNSEIGLSIHWDELLTDPRTNANRLAVQMVNSMLTLTIDQRTTLSQIDYLIRKLKEGIAAARIGTSR